MISEKPVPLDTRPLFRPLDNMLLELLCSLDQTDWDKQTVARKWKVKDVASHLLDGNLRTLSIQRDRYFGEKPPAIEGYIDIVSWLNKLNADWVEATRRISPDVLILLHRATGTLVSEHYESLHPWDEAIFPVHWAGENTSYNWMHVAREYSEKWHHQQQIREATGRDGIMTKEFFHPFMSTFMQALPHTFRNVEAEQGTLIKTTITSPAGGHWYLINENNKWTLTSTPIKQPDAWIEIPAEVSWKLFSKSVRPDDVRHEVIISGDEQLAINVLNMVSVMA